MAGRRSHVGVRLFVTCWLIYSLHFATNTVRELYPVMTLGDHASFDVSEYRGLHPDLFELPGRGVFINNNPGASILGAVPYVVARPAIDYATRRIQVSRAASDAPVREYDSVYPLAREFYRKAYERGLDVKFALVAAVTQTGVMATVSALSVTVMYRVLLGLGLGSGYAVWLALLYGLATPVFYRTAQLNHNLLVAHAAFLAFVLLWRPWTPLSGPRYFSAGLLAGWAVVLDYSGLFVPLGLAAYATIRRRGMPEELRRRSDLFRFAVGTALSLGVLIAYQWAAFGSPFLPAQHYMPATTYSGTGYQGMDWPRLDLLAATAFDLRFGLFTSAPFLLLAFWVPAWRRQVSSLLGRREWLLSAGLAAAFFLFCASNQYGWMQFNSGVRHVVPAVPFLFLMAAEAFARLPRVSSVLIGGVSLYWSWCLAMYRDAEQGFGVLQAVREVTLGGPRLPWVTTLQGLGYIHGPWPALIALATAGVVIGAVWSVRRGTAGRGRMS